ncbi:MAG: hypothetical protein A3G88_07445 [Omnitrophica WOR_2 bacterium RIFCSPLOWO2_12_FULL_63_16]|nr:MAG: hypothetical protein A3G88_07445 [Omnitrophica WOR_2 bacterium RIFCSPLOWO2_12_FULL_63_16]
MTRKRTADNLDAFLKLDQRKLADQYVVLVGAKLVAKGTDIETMLRRVKQRYPRQTPFVAKVPSPTTLILWL